MRILTPFLTFVLVISIFFAACSATTAAHDSASSHPQGLPLYTWTKSLQQNVQDSELMHNIRLHMPLRNEHLLDIPSRKGRPHTNDELERLLEQEVSSSSTLSSGCLPEEFAQIKSNDEISLRLSMWRRILAPACSTVSTATQSLIEAGIRDKCERGYDYFHCAALDVATVKRIFDLGAVERIEEKRFGLTRLSATEQARRIPAGFSFVSNVQVASDPEKHGRRHQRSHAEAQQQRRNVQDRPRQDHDGGSSSDSMAIPTFFPSSAPGTTNAPLIALFGTNIPVSAATDATDGHFHLTGAYFDVKCENKVSPTFNQNTSSISCGVGSGSSSLPQRIQLEILDVNSYPDAATAQIGSYTFSVDATAAGNCLPADMTINPMGGYWMGPPGDSSIICPFSTAGVRINLPYWKPIVLRARSVFASNVSSWTYNRAYWNSTFFGPAVLIPLQGSTSEFAVNRPQTGQFPLWEASDYLLTPPTPGFAQVPNDYRNMYKVPSAEPVAVHPALAQGVLEFSQPVGGQFGYGYNATDLLTFVQRTNNTRFNIDLVQYVGLNDSLGAAGESQLDIQMIVGVAPAVPSVFWVRNGTGSADFGEMMLEWADLIVTEQGPQMNPRPQTWSISYGSPEDGNTSSSYTLHMMRCATKIAMASSAGITVFVSSGDAGSSSSRGGFAFTPSFPANLPFIVSVGATANRWDFRSSKLRREVSNAALGDLITSGSGISTVIPIPSFQQELFDTVVAPALATANVAIPAGRLNCDIAAMGAYILAVIGGQSQSVSGTSASSPLVMSLVTLVNNRLLQAGLPTLRNANAWVNNNPQVFADIPEGGDNAFGSGFSNNVPAQPLAYRTLKGYDLPTGHGEPADFEILAASINKWQQADAKEGSNKTGEALGIGFGIAGLLSLMAVAWVIYKKSATTGGESGLSDEKQNLSVQQQQQQQAGSNYASV